MKFKKEEKQFIKILIKEKNILQKEYSKLEFMHNILENRKKDIEGFNNEKYIKLLKKKLLGRKSLIKLHSKQHDQFSNMFLMLHHLFIYNHCSQDKFMNKLGNLRESLVKKLKSLEKELTDYTDKDLLFSLEEEDRIDWISLENKITNSMINIVQMQKLLQEIINYYNQSEELEIFVPDKEPLKDGVYLTINDGPTDNFIQIIDILEKNNVKGVFFFNGANLANILREYSFKENLTIILNSFKMLSTQTKKFDNKYIEILRNYIMDEEFLQTILKELKKGLTIEKIINYSIYFDKIKEFAQKRFLKDKKILDTIIKSIKEEKIIIGNHAYRHISFSELIKNEAILEFVETDRLIEKIYEMANVTRDVKLFRYPYGHLPKRKDRKEINLKIKEFGYTIIHHTLILNQKNYKKKLKKVKKGELVLMHEEDFKILPTVINILKDHNLKLLNG